MWQDHNSSDLGPEVPPMIDVPFHLDVLPDGREAVVIGDPEGYRRFNHQQGDNPYGFYGTCGLVSCEDILRQFGVEITESDIVRYAAQRGLCVIDGPSEQLGGSSPMTQAELLSDLGVPAQVEVHGNLERLAARIESDRGVIICMNAGVLWNDATYYGQGGANHAVVVTGVARDPSSGAIQGFFINDSGTGKSAEFIDAATMQLGWLNMGGTAVVTNIAHGAAVQAGF